MLQQGNDWWCRFLCPQSAAACPHYSVDKLQVEAEPSDPGEAIIGDQLENNIQ